MRYCEILKNCFCLLAFVIWKVWSLDSGCWIFVYFFYFFFFGGDLGIIWRLEFLDLRFFGFWIFFLLVLNFAFGIFGHSCYGC